MIRLQGFDTLVKIVAQMCIGLTLISYQCGWKLFDSDGLGSL